MSSKTLLTIQIKMQKDKYINRSIKLEKIKRIVEDIKSDTEWVNDSHTHAEYVGVKSGLDMLLRHLEETKDETKFNTSFNPSVLTIPINYWVDDDGVRHIDYDLLREEYEEVMWKLRTLNIN